MGSTQVGTGLSPRTIDLRSLQARLNNSNPPICDRILEIENVVNTAIVLVGTEMYPGFSFDRLRGDTQVVTRLTHAALQNIVHVQLAPDLPHLNGFAFINKARVARDHEQPFEVQAEALALAGRFQQASAIARWGLELLPS